MITQEPNILVIDEAVVMEAEECVAACEACHFDATLGFEYILDALTGCHPTTEYLMPRAAVCPGCGERISEKTRVVAR